MRSSGSTHLARSAFGVRGSIAFACISIVAAIASGCYSNPITGRSQFLVIPESTELSLGAQSYQEATAGSGVRIIEDPAWYDPLQRVGRAIADAAAKPEYEWEFKLIDEPKTVNAWCLPGGKIAFYTGIYPILKDEAGMAIVMGHEVCHALLRHGGERMSHQLGAQAALLAGSVALSENENRESIMAALGAGAAVGFILPYSRAHETEADHQGLLLAAKAGYDPESAIGVWERMAKLGGGGPAFLSTHPPPADRIEKMREWMPKAKALFEQSRKKPNAALPQGRPKP